MKSIGLSIGNLNYDLNSELFSISFNPSGGVMIDDNILLSLSAGLGFFDTGRSNVTTYAFGAGLRYYFNPHSDKSIFFEINGALSGNSINNSSTIKGFNLGPGYALFVSDNISLDFSLKYFKSEDGSFFDSEQIAFSAGFKLFFGKSDDSK